jgi:hypothetical protein
MYLREQRDRRPRGRLKAKVLAARAPEGRKQIPRYLPACVHAGDFPRDDSVCFDAGLVNMPAGSPSRIPRGSGQVRTSRRYEKPQGRSQASVVRVALLAPGRERALSYKGQKHGPTFERRRWGTRKTIGEKPQVSAFAYNPSADDLSYKNAKAGCRVEALRSSLETPPDGGKRDKSGQALRVASRSQDKLALRKTQGRSQTSVVRMALPAPGSPCRRQQDSTHP